MERDSINWAKGREVFQRSPIFSTAQANLARDTPWLSCSQLCSRGTKVGPINDEEASQAVSQLVLPGIKPLTPASQVGEIIKSSPRRTHCKLRVFYFAWEPESTGDTASFQLRFANHQIILETRLPYACTIIFLKSHLGVPSFVLICPASEQAVSWWRNLVSKSALQKHQNEKKIDPTTDGWDNI